MVVGALSPAVLSPCSCSEPFNFHVNKPLENTVCFCASLTQLFCPTLLLRCQPDHLKSQACHEDYALHMCPEFLSVMQGWAREKKEQENTEVGILECMTELSFCCFTTL